ncbi:hypothetical protein AOC36_00350 [Erysipelothrix larvae]|uniref:N-acetyltransferase domain-containing protein n=1 Tax=Erysipelothrix larvae TaxID=1514105 RepID=A0A0X8GXZ9_9FIRM|nr:GNAT family N-acetyltransferase [Erysipelothrix larvae]AMC92497.1 hypothetical protein AOC36_00350 [Erysipelothrix larvae]
MTIIIKETTKHDLNNIMTLWNCPEVMLYVGFPEGLNISKQEIEHWFERLSQSKSEKHFSIYTNQTYCGETFYRLLNDGSCEVDIKLLPHARGKSIASYALSHTLSCVLFEHTVAFAKVDPHPDNQAAITLYERLGFYKVEGSERDMHVTLQAFKPSKRYVEDFVSLKRIPLDDYPRLWEISQKASWYPYCDTNAPYFYEYTPLSFSDFLEENNDREIQGIYFNQTLIGMINFYWEHKQTRWLEIGLVLYNHRYWGKGIGTYCLKQKAHELFTSLEEIQRVGFVTWSGNLGMQRTGDKASFKKEGVLRNVRYYEGTYYDSVRYGMTKDEWNAFNKASNASRVYDSSQKQVLCDTLLRKNPHHFGIESSIIEYVNDVVSDVVFSTPNSDGFISLKHVSETTLEINVMALDPAIHHHGYGTDLINRAIMYGREHGYHYLLVKTLAQTHPDKYYQRTRLFYEALGFKKTQLLETLWGIENPCQEYMLDL